MLAPGVVCNRGMWSAAEGRIHAGVPLTFGGLTTARAPVAERADSGRTRRALPGYPPRCIAPPEQGAATEAVHPPTVACGLARVMLRFVLAAVRLGE